MARNRIKDVTPLRNCAVRHPVFIHVDCISQGAVMLTVPRGASIPCPRILTVNFRYVQGSRHCSIGCSRARFRRVHPNIQDCNEMSERTALKGIYLPHYKLLGLSPRVNHTDRATAACRRRLCQLLRIDGATWSA
jgi:hypothetical protein